MNQRGCQDQLKARSLRSSFQTRNHTGDTREVARELERALVEIQDLAERNEDVRDRRGDVAEVVSNLARGEHGPAAGLGRLLELGAEREAVRGEG